MGGAAPAGTQKSTEFGWREDGDPGPPYKEEELAESCREVPEDGREAGKA